MSPVIGVKLTPFWIGTFLGVAPPSFVAIQAGTTLQQLTSSTDAITVWSVAILAGFAILRYGKHASKIYEWNGAYFTEILHVFSSFIEGQGVIDFVNLSFPTDKL